MINVKKIIIDDMFGVKFLYITFTVSAMIEPQENYQFDLYRSVNQSEMFSMVASDIKDFRYKDSDVHLFSISVHYYYKVKITDKTTGEISWSEPYRYMQSDPDKWGMAINRILEKYIKDTISNPKVYLLQRRKTGQRCTCYNPNRDASFDDNHEVCYGTGIVGGFYTSQEIYANYYNTDSFSNGYTINRDDDSQAPMQFWTLNFPKIEVNDIIVDGESRWIITEVSFTTKNKYILRQIVTMSRLPKTSIIHSFPITKG